MPQHPAAVAARALVRRGASLALVVLLTLLGTVAGALPAGPAAVAGEARAPASVPADPAGGHEETETAASASGRARSAVRGAGPRPGGRAERTPARPSPYGTIRGRAPVVPPAGRCAVLRC